MTPFYASILLLFRTLRLRYIGAAYLVTGLGLPAFTLGQATSQTFNSSGTYVVPAGYTAVVKVEAWGAGGGRGGDIGGGGGAYAGVDNLTLTAGSYPVTIGAGSAGGNGGNTFVQNPSNGILLTANGGSVGGPGGVASTQPTGVVSYKGGDGGARDGADRFGPSGGGSATATGPGGNGANGQGGAGEGAGANQGVNNAQAPGGGGASSAGGAAGRVIITVRSSAVVPVCGTVVYVTPTGAGLQDGSSWTNAFSGTALQTAINTAAGCGAQVWVASGTYKPTLTTGPDSRTISFSMLPGVAIYGGFLGSETALTGRPAINPASGNPSSTTLSGDIGAVGNADNSYHVIHNSSGLTATAILDGFVIRDGNANSSAANIDQVGGGMRNTSSQGCSPTIRNCLFQDNSATTMGGAIYNSSPSSGSSSPTLTNCVFQRNSSVLVGRYSTQVRLRAASGRC